MVNFALACVFFAIMWVLWLVAYVNIAKLRAFYVTNKIGAFLSVLVVWSMTILVGNHLFGKHEALIASVFSSLVSYCYMNFIWFPRYNNKTMKKTVE